MNCGFAYSSTLNNIPLLGTATQQDITGIITDENGLGLPGAVILEKGTTNGVVTDLDGKYKISASDDAILVFSYLGYIPQEINVGNRSLIDIQLLPDATQLEEVVVVGYGTQKKANLTGAISSIKMDEVATIPAANTASLLQGRMSGVTVSSGGSQPGKDDPIINIRGIGTLGNTNPMIIIDGVEATSFNQVPASDIEDITVLKDAASAAIYGVRAANGVILIRTKRGVKGKPEVNFNTNVTFSSPTVIPDYLDSWDWAVIHNEAKGQEIYTPEMIQKMRDGTNPDDFSNTDWADAVFRTGVLHREYLSIAGGGENSTYRISLENLMQEGLVKGTSNDRVNFRSNLESKLSKALTIGLNIDGARQRVEEPPFGAGEIMRRLDHFARPTVPLYYTNGYFGKWDGAPLQSINIINPLQEISYHSRIEDSYRANVQVFASVDFLKNFNFRTRASARFNHYLSSRYTPKFQDHDKDGVLRFTEPFNSLSDASSTGSVYQFDNYATYTKSFGKHNIVGLLGGSIQATKVDNMNAYIEDFPNDFLYELDAGASNPRVGGYAVSHSIRSIFGRINYDYDGKYLFEANLRRDGSSRIPKANRFGVFPSFSAGWQLSNENFLKNADILTNLKLRASWGKLGNQEIGNYPYSQTFSLRQNYLFGGTLVAGAALTDLANSRITWETTTSTDVGLDIGLFENRLTITTDYYVKNTSNILLKLPINLTLGNLSPPYQNAGEVENKGWELGILFRNSRGALNYSLGGNLSIVNNRILDLKGLEIIQSNSILRTGDPIGSYYGYIADGVYQNQAEIDNGPIRFNGVVAPGDIRYLDINGPDGVPDGKVNSLDRTIIGDPFPDLTYSFTGNFSFRGFSLSMFFQGVSGISRFSYESTNGNITRRFLDRWTEDKPSNFPRMNGISNTIGSTFWLQDASYLRLKNLEFGYDFATKFFANSKSVKNLRVYMLGTNLLTFTNLENWDPEKFSGDYNNTSYPQEKSVTIGLNVTF